MPRTCHCKFYVLKALQLYVGLQLCISLVSKYLAYIYIYMLKYQIKCNVNTFFTDKLPGFSYITTI